MRLSLLRILGLLGLVFFSFLMIRLSLPYTAMRSDVNFLLTKQYIYHLRYWRISFFTHVFTSCLVLVAGFTQFAPRLLVRRPRIHRWMGWAYLLTVVVVSGPAAFVMAIYANGGLPARAKSLLSSRIGSDRNPRSTLVARSDGNNRHRDHNGLALPRDQRCGGGAGKSPRDLRVRIGDAQTHERAPQTLDVLLIP